MPGSAHAESPEGVVQAWLASCGQPWEPGGRAGEWVVTLPGTAKLRTAVSVRAGRHGVRVTAFVVRQPDENHQRFYRWLLTRNLRLGPVAFALDRLGDVYLVGWLPATGITEQAVDELMGALLTAADSSFNELLELGFASAIRREWAWRLSRGEPTGNLAAFDSLRPMSYTLVLLRHGESEWNAKNLFTGWVDVPLSEKGEVEAAAGGRLLKEAGILPDVVHTSLLRRAITTANLALDQADRHWIPVKRDWRLNERHYGALQGKDKKQTLEAFGQEQFMLWRRSYDTPPPPIPDGDPYSQAGDPRYADLAPGELPVSECLKDVVARMLPYWESAVVPDLRAGKTVLLAAHGNSLRALVKHLDQISDDDIAGLNIPTGIPLVYRLDESLRPLVPGGEYLDPDAAVAAAAAVAAQGR